MSVIPDPFPHSPTIYLAPLQIGSGLGPLFVNRVNELPIGVYHKHGSASRYGKTLKFGAMGTDPGLDVYIRADWMGKHQPLACGRSEDEGRLQVKRYHSL